MAYVLKYAAIAAAELIIIGTAGTILTNIILKKIGGLK